MSAAGHGDADDVVTVTVTPNDSDSNGLPIEVSATVAADDDINPDTVGLYDATHGVMYLRSTNTAGYADATFQYGLAGSGWIELSGDWDGDNDNTIGLYNPVTSTFYLRNSNGSGYADVVFGFGPAGAGWTPLVGDWNNDGIDSIGLYDPNTGTFFLRNTTSLQGASDHGYADITFQYGPAHAGWLPLVGDWDNQAGDSVGLYDPNAGAFYLRNTNTSGYADVAFGFGRGGAGWTPLAGDWDGDGDDTVGLYDPASGAFYLRNTTALQGESDHGYAELVFQYGPASSRLKPFVGDWNLGSNLTAADGQNTASAKAATIAESDVSAIVDAAIARLAAQLDLDRAAVATLKDVEFNVADLAAGKLGSAQGNRVTIDGDAAGYGWFVDPTPNADEEYQIAGNRMTAISSEVVDRIDLLTVVEHELGHVLGYDDVDTAVDSLMSKTLSVGVRRDVLAIA